MNQSFKALMLATFISTAGTVQAGAPTTPVAQNTPPPDVAPLVAQLSSDDFAIREDALKKLQDAVADNMRHLVVLQDALVRLQQSMVDQIKMLTSARDMEAVARTAGLMEFNEALSKWAANVMQLPESQREEALKWGLSHDGMRIVGAAYSPRSERRVEGISAMAKVPGDSISLLLANMINDPDRIVALSSIDALWDRPPIPQSLTMLWDKAVTNTMAAYSGQQVNTRNVTLNLHGRQMNVSLGIDYNNNGATIEDSALATDVLVHLQSPDTEARLKSFISDLLSRPMDPNNGNYLYQMLLPEYGGQGQNLQRLVDAFHPKEIVRLYMQYILNGGMNDGNNGEQDINGKKFRYGPRIGMIASLCKFTGQDPDTYGIKRVPQFGNQFVIEGSQKEEDAAMAKVKSWWKDNETQYTRKPAATQSATQAAP